MKVLVLNCGSSSLKFQLIETDHDLIGAQGERTLATGIIERIGTTRSVIKYKPEGKETFQKTDEVLEHRVAVRWVSKLLTDPSFGVLRSTSEIEAVGHRVVHGGERFTGSPVITEEVLAEIVECCALAPLHNPHNITGYRAAKEQFPDIPHVAVFDTAFHQTMPPHAYVYGLPFEIYKRHGIRRYGFHGTSHRYVASRAHQFLRKGRNTLRIITAHLGNGSSMAAVDRGRSIDTTMGFTPLEGLIMGTRCGSLDPAVVLHIMEKERIGPSEVNSLMNKHSGIYGLSGISNDMREVERAAEEGNRRAELTVDVLCYGIKKYVGAYAVAMGGLDCLVFTAGIGMNSPTVRRKSCLGLEFLGVNLDEQANEACIGQEGEISYPDSPVRVLVIPTNEELVIARDTVRAIKGESVSFSKPKEEF